MRGPIFICGAGRSGKTLMRGMLSSHSQIVVTRRTEMWTHFYRRFGELDRIDNLERCLCAMQKDRHIAALAPDFERVRRDFRAGARTYPRLFALIHQQYADRCGKPRWGDQTGGLEYQADVILTAYPNARFLHLVRDPRDRYVALAKKRTPGLLTLERTTKRWICSAGQAFTNASRYPDSYRVVRYESLVSCCEETMRDVCAFLGEHFEAAMLRMDGERRYESMRRASGTNSPITDEFVGCHRDDMDRCSRSFIEIVAHREMRRFGYSRGLSASATRGQP
jgi:hypothetical protein